ncbi:MAG TPA: aspartate aminotransferase family protein [Thermomicrobiales bacterium]|nr:aspartate aminotransferase family protein [Thermomicrobiales bacterium]
MIATDVQREAFRAPDSVSAQLYERARKVLPGGNTRTTVYQSPHPPYAASGRGAVVIDADGQERLDYINNYTSLMHGHADPDITAAVIEQLQYGTAFAMPTEHEVALAELIAARVPSIDQVRFTNSGSEAVMMAVKAARAYTGRPKIVKFEGCYHGSYDFVEVSLGSTPDTWGDGDPVSVPYSHGVPQGVLDDVIVLRFNDIEMAERRIEQHRHELAAVLLDPMPLRAGMVPAAIPFLQRLRELCSAYGIVLIYDEVISLRTAYGGTQSILGVLPDLTTMAKIIGGGFPVGAVGGTREVMSVFDPSGGYPRAPHGGTFNANPITMVAGLAAMRKMTPGEFERLDRLGASLREGLAEAMDGARLPGQVTGMGSLFTIHLHNRPISDYRDSLGTRDEQARTAAIYRGLMRRGIVTAPGLAGCLSTPMGDAEINAFIEAFAEALDD